MDPKACQRTPLCRPRPDHALLSVHRLRRGVSFADRRESRLPALLPIADVGEKLGCGRFLTMLLQATPENVKLNPHAFRRHVKAHRLQCGGASLFDFTVTKRLVCQVCVVKSTVSDEIGVKLRER